MTRHSAATGLLQRPAALPFIWLALGASAFAFYARAGLTLLHYDSRAHLVVARRILDSRTPGLRQFGTHWLPLPHLLGFLPAASGFLYHTGLVSSLISFLAWWGFLVRLRRLLEEMKMPRGAIAAGTFLAALHPGLLYLAATPMTEPLFFFLLLSALVHLSRATGGVEAGADGASRSSEARKGGVWMALGCLTRFEAWGAFAAGALALALSTAAERNPGASAWRQRLRLTGAYALWPLAAIAGFLTYALWSTGSPWFLRGIDSHRFPTPPSLARALALAALGLTLQFGWLGVIALGAAVAAVLFRSPRPHPALALTLVGAPVCSIAAMWGGLGFRPRYLLSTLPLLAVGWGLAAARLRPPSRWAATAALILQGFAPLYPLVYPLDAARHLVPGFADSPAESLARRLEAECPSHFLQPRARALLFPWIDHAVLLEACATDFGRRVDLQVAHALRLEDDGEPILASMADLAGWMHASGLPIGRFIHEGNWPDYEEAVRDPRAHAGWVALRTGSDLERRLARRLNREQGFVRFVRARDPSGYGIVLFRRSSAPLLTGLTPRRRLPYHSRVPDDRIERFRRVLASHPENSLARFSLSQAYFDAGQYAEAIPELHQVIAGKPDWMLAHILLGRALIETGKPAEARPVLERGLELARLQGHAGPMAEVAEILASLRS